MSYDRVGDMTAELWKNGSVTVRTISYTYDAAGEMLTASDPSASYAYAYNSDGRVMTSSASIAGLTPQVTLTSDYNDDGCRIDLLAQIGGVNNFYNQYGYDNLGRPEAKRPPAAARRRGTTSTRIRRRLARRSSQHARHDWGTWP